MKREEKEETRRKEKNEIKIRKSAKKSNKIEKSDRLENWFFYKKKCESEKNEIKNETKKNTKIENIQILGENWNVPIIKSPEVIK